jgi:hypothetical protein
MRPKSIALGCEFNRSAQHYICPFLLKQFAFCPSEKAQKNELVA